MQSWMEFKSEQCCEHYIGHNNMKNMTTVQSSSSNFPIRIYVSQIAEIYVHNVTDFYKIINRTFNCVVHASTVIASVDFDYSNYPEREYLSSEGAKYEVG